jgi:uncharacterized coiled-coil protein SlyX
MVDTLLGEMEVAVSPFPSGMALRRTEVKRGAYRELEALCAEREETIRALRKQLLVLQQERDEARQGLEMLTQALRRRGCCDGSDHEAAG